MIFPVLQNLTPGEMERRVIVSITREALYQLANLEREAPDVLRWRLLRQGSPPGARQRQHWQVVGEEAGPQVAGRRRRQGSG